MSPDETKSGSAVPADVTGTTLSSNGQLLVDETEALVRESLTAIRANLANAPAWSGAPTPTDDFLLMFLRAEMFSSDKAAKRYRLFWKIKVTLWGEDKAHLPPKMRDETRALNTQFIQVVPGSKDLEGRQVVFIDPGNKDKSIDPLERLRAIWCILLAVLEDIETQKRGICILVSLKTSKLSLLDPKFDRMVLESIQGVLPLRVGSISLCYPPSFFRIAWAIFSKFMSKRVKQRLRIIPGPDVLVKLEEIVASTNVPEPMGPKKLDFTTWLAQRIEAEG